MGVVALNVFKRKIREYLKKQREGKSLVVSNIDNLTQRVETVVGDRTSSSFGIRSPGNVKIHPSDGISFDIKDREIVDDSEVRTSR